MPCQVIYTLNALTLLRAHDDPDYAAVLGRADLSLADGVGCAWALKHWTGKRAERVTGLELIGDAKLFQKWIISDFRKERE